MKITDRIGIFPNKKKDTGLLFTNKLISLLKGKPCEIYLPQEMREYIEDANKSAVIFAPNEIFREIPTMLITLGGDGTILHAAKAAKCPIIGINTGRLGFIAEIKKDDMGKILSVFDGNYKIEKRSMINCSVIRDGVEHDAGNALNDMVISAKQPGKMVHFEIFCDDIPVTKYYGDGLILATPTGSSAYSMAAGGPIIAPDATALCLTPICPHSLTARPIIFADTGKIAIKNFDTKSQNGVVLSLDGDASFDILPGDTVRAVKSGVSTYLIRLGENRFYDTLYKKMADNG